MTKINWNRIIFDEFLYKKLLVILIVIILAQIPFIFRFYYFNNMNKIQMDDFEKAILDIGLECWFILKFLEITLIAYIFTKQIPFRNTWICILIFISLIDLIRLMQIELIPYIINQIF